MPDRKAREVIYEEVKSRLNNQFESIDSLDKKSGIVIGFVGVILSLSIRDIDGISFRIAGGTLQIEKLLLLLATTLLFLSAWFAFKSFEVRTYRRDPEPHKLILECSDYTYSNLTTLLTKKFSESFEENKVIVCEKKSKLNTSLKLIFMSLVLLTLDKIKLILV